MTCISPPELGDAVLLAYLEGEVDEAVRTHVAECEHCRGRAMELARWQAQLQRQLYRHNCPEPQELAEYQEGLHDTQATDAIELHLQSCPHCNAELEALIEFSRVTAGDLEVSTFDRVKVILGKLIQAPAPPGPSLQPALAGVRGEGEGTMIFEAGEARIAIEVHPDPEVSSQRAVYGLLTGLDNMGSTASMFLGDKQISGTNLDPQGNFVLQRLEPEAYSLHLSGENWEILLRRIDVD